MNDTGSSRSSHLSRRSVLISAGVVAGLGVVPRPAAAAGAGPTIPKKVAWTAARTQNGWPVLDSGVKIELEGMDGVTRLRSGQVATVLQHVVRRFSYEISELNGSEVHGFRADTAVAAPFESNYLSGTAVAIQPGLYPTGSTGNLFPLEMLVVRDILAECGGVVRWGGDDPDLPKEGHFQIDVPPGSPRLTALVATLNQWGGEPGLGAGGPVDLTNATRLNSARALARIQHR